MPGRAKRLRLEVIATSLDDALAAEQGGADRLELVSDLPRGGMTPPPTLAEQVLSRVRIPVRAMLRRTEAHEVARADVRSQLFADASAFSQLPLHGIVVGVLRGGEVDVDLLELLLSAARARATFHRAFEALSAPETALATLGAVAGVDRVLTSGGEGTWARRAARLARWAGLAAPRLHILVGGGVTEQSLAEIAAVPGISEVHVGRAARTSADELAPVSDVLVAQLVRRLEALTC